MKDENQCLELWNKGLSLGAASYRFAHPQLKAEYDERRNAKMPKLATPEPIPDARWWEMVGAMFEAYQPIAEARGEIAKADQRLKDYLMQLIGNGQVLAFGYALPRAPEDFPVRVPLDVWSGKIDWYASTVKGNGLEFVAVRVLPIRFVQEFAPQKLLPPEEKKSGRPSIQQEIFEAYESLKGQGAINFDASMKSHYPLIRDFLCKAYPDKAGQFQYLADETIRRVITDDFNTNKQ